jgi:hypothetical protein
MTEISPSVAQNEKQATQYAWDLVALQRNLDFRSFDPNGKYS